MLPNLLATKWGRLLTFFLLYITEGIPLGFTATAMVTQMRKSGMKPEAIGLFVGSLYLPWAWKWAAGPFVDLIYSNRFGRRRLWIIGTQLLMVLTLLACLPLDLVTQFSTLVWVLGIHNTCCAVQDVAIDALACETLKSDERGLGNGLMFAGASIGQAIGGAGVLFLMEYLVGDSNAPSMTPAEAFSWSYWFVAACLFLVTACVAIPLREQPVPRPVGTGKSPLGEVWLQLKTYVVTAAKSFVGSQTAFVGLMIACLPAGAAALGLALQTTLSVELGFTDTDVAQLALYSTFVNAGGCCLGGLLSDRLGRRKTLACCVLLCSIPTAWLGVEMQRHDWIMPVDMSVQTAAHDATHDAAASVSGEPSTETSAATSSATTSVATSNAPVTARRTPPDELVKHYWLCCIFYNAMYGLLIGSQIPVFMEITNPAVAATQFTAYMAFHNLVTSYTATWQGYSISKWGYPTTLFLDATIGLVGIGLYPFLKLTKRTDEEIAVQRDADLGH